MKADWKLKDSKIVCFACHKIVERYRRVMNIKHQNLIVDEYDGESLTHGRTKDDQYYTSFGKIYHKLLSTIINRVKKE